MWYIQFYLWHYRIIQDSDIHIFLSWSFCNFSVICDSDFDSGFRIVQVLVCLFDLTEVRFYDNFFVLFIKLALINLQVWIRKFYFEFYWPEISASKSSNPTGLPIVGSQIFYIYGQIFIPTKFRSVRTFHAFRIVYKLCNIMTHTDGVTLISHTVPTITWEDQKRLQLNFCRNMHDDMPIDIFKSFMLK